MATNTAYFECPPRYIFDVLGNGWLYTAWVVGTARTRAVHPQWPEKNTLIHHSFGVWPLLINDTTSILEWDPEHRAVFQARGWPLGEARVVIDVKPRGRGSVIRITEYADRGPGRLIRRLLDPLVWLRNRETLRRLGDIAAGQYTIDRQLGTV